MKRREWVNVPCGKPPAESSEHLQMLSQQPWHHTGQKCQKDPCGICIKKKEVFFGVIYILYKPNNSVRVPNKEKNRYSKLLRTFRKILNCYGILIIYQYILIIIIMLLIPISSRIVRFNGKNISFRLLLQIKMFLKIK